MLALGMVGCSTSYRADPSSSTNAIVGGVQDLTSFPAVGYLVFRLNQGPYAGQTWRPDCGATLVTPTLVITAAHCVEELTTQDRTVTGVGFGDGLTGPVVGVLGTWRDWVNPAWMPEPDGGADAAPNYAADVALVPLAASVDSAAPMAVAAPERNVPDGTAALVIGYGRVTPAPGYQPITERLNDRDMYPGQRKEANLVVSQGTDSFLLGAAAPGTTGGICYGDSGGALILGDGALLGVLSTVTADTCTPTGSGLWADLRLPMNGAFLQAHLVPRR
jgi:hypothetical protein